MKLWDLIRELKALDSHVDKDVKLLFPPDINERFKINYCNFVVTTSRLEKDIIYLRAIHPKWEDKKDE